ncbi:MAG: hypothetical protein AAFU78_18190 [Cyanobacteria bacterium J06633_2]
MLESLDKISVALEQKVARKNEENARSTCDRFSEVLAEKVGSTAADPAIRGAAVTSQFTKNTDLSKKRYNQRQRTAEALQRNDLSDLEKMLVSQTYSLDAAFNELLLKSASVLHSSAAGHKGKQQGIQLFELALKAQKQCKQTVMSLNEIRNPKRATFIKNQLNQLVQERENHDAGVDSGAQRLAASTNPAMETVGEEYRATNGRGKKTRVAECSTV